MLSSSPIKNVAHASHYFMQDDNYYTKEQGVEQSEWWGKGCEKLSLTGQVDATIFTELLTGKLPNGTQVGKVVDGQIKHRPGWDLTFSAPKSVSILALVGEDKRLIEAHQKAVKTTLAFIERGCAQARIQVDGKQSYQNTNNLLTALFKHDVSRAQDPQLHTHCVTFNVTERSDGRFLSLASSRNDYRESNNSEINGFIERLRRNNRHYSKMYEAELAYQVKELGYEIRNDTKSGIFEICGIPQELIDSFSKRRAEIKEQLSEKGMSGGKASAIATLDTRQSKAQVNRPDLQIRWALEAKAENVDLKMIISESKIKLSNPPELSLQADKKVLNLVRSSVQSLSVFQSTFSLEEALSATAPIAIKEGINTAVLISAVEKLKATDELIQIKTESGKNHYMYSETLQIEKSLIEHLQDNSLVSAPTKRNVIFKLLTQIEDKSYHGALKEVFSDKRALFVEGAGNNIDFVRSVLNVAKSAGLNVAFISPNSISCKQSSFRLKPQHNSIWEYISSFFAPGSQNHYSVHEFISKMGEATFGKAAKPELLFVEHANLLSTYQHEQLQRFSKENAIKLILNGNKDTLLSQKVGISIEELTKKGLPNIKLPTTNDTAQSKAQENRVNIYNKLDDKIIELNNKDERISQMAAHFCRIDPEARKNSWLVTHTNLNKHELNTKVHDKLASQNALGTSKIIDVLVPVYIKEGQGALAGTYKEGQTVRFNEKYTSLGIDKGEYLTVLSNSKVSNRVVLARKNGNFVVWRPDKIAGHNGKIEIFEQVKRELAVNEIVSATRNIATKQIVKGERLTISSFSGTFITLKASNGKTIILDARTMNHRHIDYGYASTLHAIAHEKPDVLIADFPSKSFFTDQRRLKQSLIQAQETWLYTDNAQSLLKNIENKTGDKPSAHLTLQYSNTLKKYVNNLFHILETQILQSDSKPLLKSAVDSIEYAMHHLAERKAGFTHKELITVALNHALGEVNTEALQQAVIATEKAGIILRGKGSGGTLWTTIDAVKMEREIIALCNSEKNKIEPLANELQIEANCKNQSLKEEQVNAVKAILQSKDRMLAIQGYAGTGKTSMLVTVADILAAKPMLNEAGIELLGLAPTHTAVKELTSRGINAQTLDSFIISMKQAAANSSSPIRKENLVLVIDEASMVSNRKMLEILKLARDLDCRRVIAIGDTRQLSAVEAGKPFSLVQTQVETKHLIDIRRQSDNAPNLKSAVAETINYNFREAFRNLKNSIIEVPNLRETRAAFLANDYLSYPFHERDKIQVITPGHDDRKLVNDLIREGLKQEGVLLKCEDQNFNILKPKNLTQIERSHITNLEKGDVLRFNKQESSYIKSSSYLTIIDIDKSVSVLTLKDNSSNIFYWQIPIFNKSRLSSIEVFQKEERAVQAGDLIRWSRSDKRNEIFSTESATVKSIQGSQIIVELGSNKLFVFDAHKHEFQHWDIGYAATVYAAQGKTKDIVLAHMESFRENLTTQPSFLVALTRAVNTFRLYTDNASKLLKTIQNNTGVNLSSLEVIGEYPAKKAVRKANLEPTTTLADILSTNSKDRKSLTKDQVFDRISIHRIREDINKYAREIAIDIMGVPKERHASYLKFGSNNGSLVVTVKGEKQGWFNDFQTNTGGRDMLKFIEIYGGMDRKSAVVYAQRWLGPTIDNISVSKLLPSPKQVLTRSKNHVEFSAAELKKIQFAEKIASESLPIKGTLAEKYLTKHRGIDLNEPFKDLRYHPRIYSAKNQKSLPALVAIARNIEGKIQSIEATFLDKKDANKADVTLQKQTFGPKKGTLVTVNQSNDPNAPTLIAEGVVTGLSLALALPNVNVKVTLGKQMFASIDPKMVSNKVVFCLDNDGQKLAQDSLIKHAVDKLVSAQKEVSLMIPTALNKSKQDYNDILVVKGNEQIVNDYNKSSYALDYYNNLVLEDKSIPKEAVLPQIKNPDDALNKAYQALKNPSYGREDFQQKIPTKTEDIEREI